MFTRLEIENYRGIARGEMKALAPLTVLVGPNNSGKSSVLEALFLAASAGDLGALDTVITRRGWVGFPTINAWLPKDKAKLIVEDNERTVLQTNIEIKPPFEVVSLTRSSKSPEIGSASVKLNEAGPLKETSSGILGVQPSFLEVDTARENPRILELAVSHAELQGRRAAVIDLLRALLPSLIDLRILVPGDRATLFIEDESGVWPLVVAGDGLKRLVLLAARIGADKSGLVLVEEPECHLHVGALKQVASLFWGATKAGTQIVATTHSLELLDALFLNASPEELDRSAVFRMSLRKGELTAVRVGGAKVRELRAEIGEDLR